jgi:hypothetical protein
VAKQELKEGGLGCGNHLQVRCFDQWVIKLAVGAQYLFAAPDYAQVGFDC